MHVHVKGSPLILPLILFAFSLPFLIGTMVNRWGLQRLRQALGASVFMNTLWFRHRGVPVVLQKGSSTKEVYTWKVAWNARGPRGYMPLFGLFIPIHDKQFWFIRKVGSTLVDTLANKLSGNRVQDVDVQGQKYKVWAQDKLLQERIAENMAMIAPLFEALLSKNISWGSISTDRSPLFYDWRLHYCWFVGLSGMPEGIHEHPDQLLAIVDGVLDILKVLGVNPRD